MQWHDELRSILDSRSDSGLGGSDLRFLRFVPDGSRNPRIAGLTPFHLAATLFDRQYTYNTAKDGKSRGQAYVLAILAGGVFRENRKT
jgi:hypothetical protein